MLSKYSRSYSVDNGVALYSTISGALVFIPDVGADDLENELSAEAIEQLKRLRLFFDSKNAEKAFVSREYRRMRQSVDRCLYLTVEITTSCNFQCRFCYQNKDIRTRTMNDRVEKALMTFLGKSDLSTFNSINVNFIGGEPLLFPDRVKSVWKGIVDLAHSQGCSCSAKMNTNGYCLTEDIIRTFENTEFVIPLGAKSDYGSIIRLIADSFCELRSDIKNRLGSLVSVFKNNNTNRIVLRYNVNHENMGYVGEYFKEVADFGFPNYSIDIVNTNNATHSHYQNELDDDGFWRWYLDVVVPLCAQYSLPEPIRFRNELSRCKARRRGSFKLFADGRVGLCNGVDHSQSLPFIQEFDSIEDIDKHYADVKVYDYMLSDKCRNCDEIFVCGGDAICHVSNCEGKKSRIEEYVRKKIELMRG